MQEVQRKPIPHSYKTVCWKYEEIFQEKISKVEKIKCTFLEFYFDSASSSRNSTSGACLLAWAPSWKLTFLITPALGALMVCCTEHSHSEQQTTQGSLPSSLQQVLCYSLVQLELTHLIPSSDMLYFKPSLKHYPSPFWSSIFSWIFVKYTGEKNAI